MTSRHVKGVAALVGIAALIVAYVVVRPFDARRVITEPGGIMDTETQLVAISPKRAFGKAIEGAQRAEAALRGVEARLSVYLDRSDVGVLNSAPAGATVDVSDLAMGVLVLSAELDKATEGAFDITFAPVFAVWSAAGKAKQRPSEDALAAAVAASGWEHFELGNGVVVKATADAKVNLGGIAKGYGIDLAAEEMIRVGCVGGLVEVGGDIRCFGAKEDGSAWVVAVRNPFGRSFAEREPIGLLTLHDGAVCTSGNYARYTEIDGQRYSHIIDPRTGRPTDVNPSVTVIAPSAAVADAWATALSVLGVDGLKLLPEDVHAIIITGEPDDFAVITSDGFATLDFEFSAAFKPHLEAR